LPVAVLSFVRGIIIVQIALLQSNMLYMPPKKEPTKRFLAITLVRALPHLLRRSLSELQRNDPLRMAGATAFFTTFALPPIIVILIQVLKLVLDPEMIRNELFDSLSEIVGPEAVAQLNRVLLGITRLAHNWWVTAAGFLFLVFVATNLFSIIKHSINQIWKIKPQKRRGVFKKMRTRSHAIIVILVAGFLFLIGIIAETLQTFIGQKIFSYSPLLSFYFNTTVNYVLSLLIVTIWFAIMFRYLPDGRPSWRIALTGALVTSLLFLMGRFVLHLLLSYSNINTLYGTSASIVLLLLFVFYSALILFFGAAFTKVWALHCKKPIQPLSYAMHYRLVESPAEEEHT
jgi:membrane protein